VGVAVNAGTAAAIAARGPEGATWDMGWWGQHAMGALGLVPESFKAVYLACLGAAPQTALGPALDAIAEGGVSVRPAVTGRLAATIPPPSFFRA